MKDFMMVWSTPNAFIATPRFKQINEWKRNYTGYMQCKEKVYKLSVFIWKSQKHRNIVSFYWNYSIL